MWCLSDRHIFGGAGLIACPVVYQKGFKVVATNAGGDCSLLLVLQQYGVGVGYDPANVTGVIWGTKAEKSGVLSLAWCALLCHCETSFSGPLLAHTSCMVPLPPLICLGGFMNHVVCKRAYCTDRRVIKVA